MKQPKALYMLFFAEMWERFSFYGMRALLILYMTQKMLMDDDAAVGVYAAYGALVYATPFIGGMIADNFLGYRKSVLFGGILMTVGHFIMAFDTDATFYGALALLILGNGFFKPNISSMVGGLYGKDDPRRDGGFTIFYMGINLGAFLAPLVCGIIGEGFGWHYGFGLAGVGMLLGLIVFWRGQDALGDKNGLVPDVAKLKKKVYGLISTEYLIYTLTMLMVPLFALLVMKSHVAEILNLLVAIGAVGSILFLSFKSYDGVERQRLWVILVLIVFSTLFWAFFEQAGSSINLYTARNVDRSMFGIEVPASVFQSVNPLFIILLAPMFASLWLRLKRVNKEPSTPLKFALGILQLGIGFFFLVLGATQGGDSGKSSVIFLILGYLFHTTGELCLSPVGLSMVTKLSPKKIVGMCMGVWLISSSLAHIVGGLIAKQTSTSAYMVPVAQYTPEVGQTTPVTFDLVVKDGGDGLESGVLKVNVDFENQKEEEKSLDAKETFVKYISVQPDSSETFNLRVPYLDPTGDLTEVNVDTENLPEGVKVSGDELVYTGGKELKQHSFSYQMCDVDEGKECHDVRIEFTVDTASNHAPEMLIGELNYSMAERGYFSKFLGEATISVPVTEFVKDIDGDALSIFVKNKPESGYVTMGKSLHKLASPNKMIKKYSNVFQLIGFICLGAFVVLLLLVPTLKKWMNGIS